jgi:hypothetical protein
MTGAPEETAANDVSNTMLLMNPILASSERNNEERVRERSEMRRKEVR